MSTLTGTVSIWLDTWRCKDVCESFAFRLYEQLSSGKYDEMAVMDLPTDLTLTPREKWESQHRTARKRAWRAEHHGYFAARINRNEFEEDVWAVNLSRPTRQGRPMSQGYVERPEFDADDYPCPLHGVHSYGVLDDHGTLVAYLWMYRSAELALVSQVLGHAAHEDFGVMYLLFREALVHEANIGPGMCVYNRYDSGTDGLRFLKDRIGFKPETVRWLA